jgi:hypothetical protein
VDTGRKKSLPLKKISLGAVGIEIGEVHIHPPPLPGIFRLFLIIQQRKEPVQFLYFRFLRPKINLACVDEVICRILTGGNAIGSHGQDNEFSVCPLASGFS